MKYIVFVLFLFATCQLQAAERTAFIDDLMSKMTLEEKIGQLNLPSVGFDVTGPILSEGVEKKIEQGHVGGVFNTFTPNAVRKLQELAVTKSRLKIPLLFGYDVIHGHKTIFPIPLGMAATWDIDLIERTARAAAREASADGLNWTFSPMVDIARDPRWGRVAEGAGEDPFLGSRIAEAMVRGYQGTDLSKNDTILACVKHFALYGASEAGRDYNTTDMSRLRMYSEYLPPYKAAVDAGARTVMTSFNEIDGMPATGNRWLLTDLLRNEWGFTGLVVTDYTAILEMVNHGVGDGPKVSELAINAGTDMDMVSEFFVKYLPELVKSGKVDEKTVDAACRRILEAKYDLGLFEDPFRYVSEERAKKEIRSADKLELAKEAALKSFVLLKNDKNVLPLDASKKIAFIGPLVDDKRNLIGSWSGAGDWKQAVSIREALEAKFGKDKFLFAKGCNLIEKGDPLYERLSKADDNLKKEGLRTDLLVEAIKTAEKADVVVVVLGETYDMSGEAASYSHIELPKNQSTLLRALSKEKPTVLVLMSGRPQNLNIDNSVVAGVLETWFGGHRAGDAIVETLFGDSNPSGKLTMSFPHGAGQIPVYYNHKNTGRPLDENQKYTTKFLDIPNEPLYPFGFGLSYTTFSYGDVKLSDSKLKRGDKLTASVEVSNTGSREGTETVQLYLRDVVGSITRPVKELKGFQRITLKPGEKKTVSFEINEEMLKFYNAELKFVAEPGIFKVFFGGNSRDVKEATFELTP